MLRVAVKLKIDWDPEPRSHAVNVLPNLNHQRARATCGGKKPAVQSQRTQACEHAAALGNGKEIQREY